MADLLKKWANGMGITTNINEFERDLANGFCFGEILAHPDYDLMTAEDFATFADNDSAEAKVSNFQHLAPVLRDLGIKFDSLIANQIMTEHHGVALRLLHQIKQSLQSLKKNAFSSSTSITNYTRNDKPSQKTSVSYLMGQKTMGKTRYEDIESSRFDDKLRKMVPNSYEQKLATHLQPWKDHRTEMEELNAEITADEKEHERLREVERRQGMLDKYHQNKQFMQEWQSQGTEAHAKNMNNRRDETKRCLGYELATRENAARRTVLRTDNARHDVEDSIDAFETTLRRLGKAETEDIADGEVKKRLQAPPVSTLEHMRTIERSLPAFDEMGHSADNYIRTIKKKKAEEDVSRKERDRRRRKVLLDQQSAQKELEMRRREEMLLEKLCRQSKEERKVAESLWECQLHKDILKENRKFRDRQEEAARARDKELQAEAERGARQAAYEEYQRRVEATLVRRSEFEDKLAAEKAQKHYDVCLEVMEGALDIVARIVTHKEDTDGQWPTEELAEWTVQWTNNEPIWPPPPPPPDPVAEAKRAAEDAAARDPVKASEQPQLDEMEWKRYVTWAGPWAWIAEGEQPKELLPSQSRPPPEGVQTTPLCDLVSKLDKRITPVEPCADPPDVPQFPVAVSVIGKPFSGKTDLCEALAEKNVRRICPDGVVQAAVDAYRKVMIDGGEVVGRKLELGQRAFEQLASGRGVDDRTVVDLIISAIQNLACEPELVSGYVLDGFPITVSQGRLLENSLTGYQEPLEGPAKGLSSELASLACTVEGPAADSAEEKAVSGLKGVLRLDIEDSTAEERAHGRVVDIDEGARYHLQSDPPTMGSGAFNRLAQEENESSADLHIGPRLAAAKVHSDELNKFLDRFGVVQAIDAEEAFAAVKHIGDELVADLLYRWDEEKNKNMKARPPTSLSFLAEPPKPESLPLTVTEGVKDLQLAELLLSQWVEVEQRYKQGAKDIFSKLRVVRREAVPHYAGVRDSMIQFLRRPDERQVVAQRFHDGFNAIEEWMRSDVEVKQELHLRCEELLEQLWDVSDGRKDAANEERYALLGCGWLQDKCGACTVGLAELMSLELMRYQAARGMLEAENLFRTQGDVPDPGAVLEVALQLGEVLTPPADGAPPRQPEDDSGIAPTLPQAESLTASLKEYLVSALALVTEEGLEEHPIKDQLMQEVLITQQRLKAIASRGELLITGLHHRGATLGSQMESWLEARYTAEVASSTGFAAQVREAIEGEELLVHDITLEDTEFQIDEGTRLVPYVSESREEGAEAEPLPDRSTLTQLTMIHEHLVNAAPSGIMTGEDFVWLLRRLVADGGGPLPLEWMSSDEEVINKRLSQLQQALDIGDCGTISWREFLVCAVLPSYPNTVDLLEMRKAFGVADTDGDSRVTMDEYKSVKLWFEANSKLDDARKDGIKGLLYQLFTVADPNQPDNDDVQLFDFLACLLHLCADDSQQVGVQKAFKMLAGGDAPLKKEEVARIATAGVGVLDDMQVAGLAQVFSGKADSARTQLEPIMADPHGNAMMMAQRVYQRKHIY